MSEAEIAKVREEIAELRRRADAAEKVTTYLQRGWEAAMLDRQRKAVLALLSSAELLEELAAVEHERWSGWEKYREDALERVTHPFGEPYEKRWRRLRETAYADLTDDERESDRQEVQNTLAAIKAFLTEAWNGDAGE